MHTMLPINKSLCNIMSNILTLQPGQEKQLLIFHCLRMMDFILPVKSMNDGRRKSLLILSQRFKALSRSRLIGTTYGHSSLNKNIDVCSGGRNVISKEPKLMW